MTADPAPERSTYIAICYPDVFGPEELALAQAEVEAAGCAVEFERVGVFGMRIIDPWVGDLDPYTFFREPALMLPAPEGRREGRTASDASEAWRSLQSKRGRRRG